jgi:hypothetical protein
MFEKYRYHTLFFADILTYDSREREALTYLFQVIYLDINGVVNSKNIKGRPVFVQRAVKKPVDLIAEARVLKNKLNLPMEEVQAIFLTSVRDLLTTLGPFPPLVSPEDAWTQVLRIIE